MKRIMFGLVLGLLALAGLGLGSGAQAATPCADLVVDSVTTAPAQPVMSQPSTISVSVRNAGTCAVDAFGVQLRPDLLAAALPTTPVAGLDAGATTVVSFPYSFPRAGIFLGFATVDVTNAVAETNEGNNLASKAFVPSPGVDLVITSMSVDAATPTPGQPVTVSIAVLNLGPNPAGAFRVDWSPSLGAPAIQRQVAGLAGGATATVSIPFAYPNAGAFDGLATADAGSSVPESNEFNNARLFRVNVTAVLPDLVVGDVHTDPPTPFAGSAVTASVTVRNDGLAAAGSFTVRWQPWLLGAAVTTQIDGLAAGSSTTVDLSSLFSYTGTFGGSVTVDSANAVTELSELNNGATTQVTVGPPTLNAQKVATGGFGDYQNGYSWSMAWFKGKLYVGTARSQHCVEQETLDFFFPGNGHYRGPLDGLPEANCPVDPYDMDLRAEIWQYTPETGIWKRAYQAPTVPNPRAPGKTVGRDIGYRGMVVYTDPSTGEQALYVGGVTADEYIPELAEPYPPRILRSVDGETFTPLPTGPGIIHNTSGDQRPIGFRAMAEFGGRLFATASGGLGGDGVILEVKNPSGPSPSYVQVSPNTFQVYEMEPFNGALYVGTSAAAGGYAVKRITDMSSVPFQYADVVSDGAGRGSQITSVVSMHVFKGRLYVGANGWAQGGQSVLRAEEIRVNPDDTWDVVAGAPRTLADGTAKAPISGLGDGFGNFFNVHMWWAETHNGAMYIGTNDASGAWQDPRLGPIPALLGPEFGFDVWGTCDGQYWWQVTRNAFGDGQWNFGARTLASTPFGLFIGSTNHVQGTSVWKGDASPCGSTGGGPGFGSFKPVNTPAAAKSSAQKATGATRSNASLARPGELLTNVQPCGTALSWTATPQAKSYRILRSEYRSINLNMSAPPRLPNGDVLPDAMPIPAFGAAGAKLHRRIEVAGPYVTIGETSTTTFVDRSAKSGSRYNYEVVAVDASGADSEPSNVATSSVQASKAPFGDLNTAIRRLVDVAGKKHGADALDPSRLTPLATAARTTWRKSGPTAALRNLTQLRKAIVAQAAHARGAAQRTAVGDVRTALGQLERRLKLDATCNADRR
jgi:hypothetical protein